jgi:hypothetical protein
MVLLKLATLLLVEIESCQQIINLLRHGSWIAIPVPSASDVSCHINSLDIKTLIKQLLKLINSPKASTDHQRVEILGLHHDFYYADAGSKIGD